MCSYYVLHRRHAFGNREAGAGQGRAQARERSDAPLRRDQASAVALVFSFLSFPLSLFHPSIA
jgi:hypothetical protein